MQHRYESLLLAVLVSISTFNNRNQKPPQSFYFLLYKAFSNTTFDISREGVMETVTQTTSPIPDENSHGINRGVIAWMQVVASFFIFFNGL